MYCSFAAASVDRESLLPVGRLKRDAASWFKNASAETSSSSVRRQDLAITSIGSVSEVISRLEQLRKRKAEETVSINRGSGKAWQRKYGNAAENLDANKAAS